MKRLTKSQYELIASTIKDERNRTADASNWSDQHKTWSNDTLKFLALNLSGQLADSDNQFDQTKFLKLCGITD